MKRKNLILALAAIAALSPIGCQKGGGGDKGGRSWEEFLLSLDQSGWPSLQAPLPEGAGGGNIGADLDSGAPEGGAGGGGGAQQGDGQGNAEACPTPADSLQGLVNDGLSSQPTDNSARIQAALDEAAAAKRAYVQMAPGVYGIKRTIMFPGGVSLRGAGSKCTSLRMVGLDTPKVPKVPEGCWNKSLVPAAAVANKGNNWFAVEVRKPDHGSCPDGTAPVLPEDMNIGILGLTIDCNARNLWGVIPEKHDPDTVEQGNAGCAFFANVDGLVLEDVVIRSGMVSALMLGSPAAGVHNFLIRRSQFGLSGRAGLDWIRAWDGIVTDTTISDNAAAAIWQEDDSPTDHLGKYLPRNVTFERVKLIGSKSWKSLWNPDVPPSDNAIKLTVSAICKEPGTATCPGKVRENECNKTCNTNGELANGCSTTCAEGNTACAAAKKKYCVETNPNLCREEHCTVPTVKWIESCDEMPAACTRDIHFKDVAVEDFWGNGLWIGWGGLYKDISFDGTFKNVGFGSQDIVATSDTCSGSASVSGQIIDSGGGRGWAVALMNGGTAKGWTIGPLLIHYAPAWGNSTAIALSTAVQDILIKDVKAEFTCDSTGSGCQGSRLVRQCYYTQDGWKCKDQGFTGITIENSSDAFLN